MRLLSGLFLLQFAAPALASVPPHGTRTMPELSDIALFVMAVAGVWLVRRALRKRFARPADTAED